MISIDPKFNIYDGDLNEGDEDFERNKGLTLEQLRDEIFDLQYDNYVDDYDPDTDDERIELENKLTDLLESCDLPKLQCILHGVGYYFTQTKPNGQEEVIEYGEEVMEFFQNRRDQEESA